MNDTRPFTVVLFIALMFLALISGYYAGRLLAIPLAPLFLQLDDRMTMPTVQLHGMRNGQLHGHIHGSVRFLVGSHLVPGSGSFAVDPGPLAFNTIDVQVPPGMQFVASRRGTKYYPVTSSAGNRIIPSNRVYFRSATHAEAAGYDR